MAPTQKKLKEFFGNKRRKMILDDWRPLKSAGGEFRIKLLLRLPLLNESHLGVPDEISRAFNEMSQDDSPIDSSKLNILYDGMTVEFFATEESQLPWNNGKEGSQGGHASVTGVLFDKFVVIAKGKGEKRTVDLAFLAYVSLTPGIKDWIFENLHGTVFGEATYSQSEMGNEFMKEDPDEEPSTDDSQEEEGAQLTLVPSNAAPEPEPDWNKM
jgi:hypothetical protein